MQPIYLDHGGAARCKLPFALRPGPSQEDVRRTKEITKERQREEQRKPSPRPYSSPADAMKGGVGGNSGSSSPAPKAPAAPPALPPAPGAPEAPSLTPHSRRRGGTSLPTSVERKSSTARLHLSSARRSRIFHRPFHLPVSFFTSAHSTFCWAFHSGHTLKRCSRVWVGYRHHQHSGVGWFLVQLRYWSGSAPS